MADNNQKQQNFGVIKSSFGSTEVRQKFEEVMGRRAPSFISSVLFHFNCAYFFDFYCSYYRLFYASNYSTHSFN